MAQDSSGPSRIKQVIVVDASLALPPGKLAAQAAHAAIIGFLTAPARLQRAWLETGMAKIVLACESAEALAAIAAAAEARDLPTGLVRDAGRTVLDAGTATCVGIGPAEAERIDEVTGSLALLR